MALPPVPLPKSRRICGRRATIRIICSGALMGWIMNPRALLGVFIRAFGLWLIYQALYGALFVLIKLRMAVPSAVPPSENEAFTAFYLVVGLIAIVLADSIVHLVYGDQRKLPDEG
jgi:hypothetical protein